MKINGLIPLVLVAFSFSQALSFSAARAGDDSAAAKAKPNTAPQPNTAAKPNVGGPANTKNPKAGDPTGRNNSEFQIETQAVGKMIVVGPNGEVQIQDFNGQGNDVLKDLLDKLPDDLRGEFEKLQALDGLKGLPAGGLNQGVSGKVKIVTIGPDGVRQEVESDLGTPLPGNPIGADVDVAELLKKAGVNLPPEAQQALEAAQKANRKVPQKAGVGQAQPANDLGSKLDKILERLEKIEKEVANLKAQKSR